MLKILVIDDDRDCCEAMEIFLSQLPGCRVHKAGSGEEGWELFRSLEPDLIFCDVKLPGMDGIEFTRLASGCEQKTDIVLLSGIREIIRSQHNLVTGAAGFIPKPVDIRKLKEIVDKIKSRFPSENPAYSDIEGKPDSELIPIPEFTGRGYTFPGHKQGVENAVYLGSAPMGQILHKLEKLWCFPEIPILLEGRTGTGKEIVARYIHHQRCKKDKPFIAINCATLSRDLFASELFGYEQGAFTGAAPGGHPGFLKIAEQGTLFLDEITEIPLETQSQLLRVIQEGEYYRVGGRSSLKTDTKIIFATNRDIRRMVQEGRFREDLYYRINVCRVKLPPLAAQKEAIIPLCRLFLQQLNSRSPGQIKAVEAGFIKRLRHAPWQGNIRELKNQLLKTALLCETGILSTGDFTNPHTAPEEKAVSIDPSCFRLPAESFDLEDYVRQIVKKTLLKYNGNKTRAARYLHLSRMQLYNKYRV